MAGSCASSRFFETAVFLVLGFTNINISFGRMVAVLSWYVCNIVAGCVVNVYNGGLFQGGDECRERKLRPHLP